MDPEQSLASLHTRNIAKKMILLGCESQRLTDGKLNTLRSPRRDITRFIETERKHRGTVYTRTSHARHVP